MSIEREPEVVECEFVSGERSVSNWQTGRFDYKLAFKITNGEHAGETAYRKLWGTEKGEHLGIADARKLGFCHPGEMCSVIPSDWRIRIKAGIVQEDDWQTGRKVWGITWLTPLNEKKVSATAPVAPPLDLKEGEQEPF